MACHFLPKQHLLAPTCIKIHIAVMIQHKLKKQPAQISSSFWASPVNPRRWTFCQPWKWKMFFRKRIMINKIIKRKSHPLIDTHGSYNLWVCSWDLWLFKYPVPKYNQNPEANLKPADHGFGVAPSSINQNKVKWCTSVVQGLEWHSKKVGESEASST